MKQYKELIQHVLENGYVKSDRTGVGTRSIFGYQMRFDLTEGFPVLTTKRIAFSLVKSELLWFLKGDTNIRFLLKHHNHIWDEWAFKQYVESDDYIGPDMSDFGKRSLEDQHFAMLYQQEMALFHQQILTDDQFAFKYGDLGEVYGKQWRSWQTREGGTIDQIQQVLDSLISSPDSRRHIVTAWNPEDVPNAALPPCHILFQFYVADNKLSCQLYQRSADIFLGVPFNIASYALLIHLIAREIGLEVGEFIHTIGDAHIYENHLEAVRLLMQREPRELPYLVLETDKKMAELTVDDIRLEGYRPHDTIKAPIAV
ncbi:thymidylate synthase [Facklamia lactis]|uniref:thymidylate synthase n=1 Tax=Facklamia lactis TaxID=2749967 RepID=UPI0018CFA52D|nr:thymidylate synthase [Facklamia lactis]MBG9979993.1 thymidylate synthase [Facklamia lactis]